MQSHYAKDQHMSDLDTDNYQPLQVNATSKRTNVGSGEATESAGKAVEPMCFRSHFEDCMEMYADADTVANYLNTHQGWFCRCAHPMTAEPLGDNGYVLTIGRFGAFGYDVEPKIGLELLPPVEMVYRMRTVPVPNYIAPGYEVDYQAAMHLVEVTDPELLPPQVSALTRVEWQLDLAVTIQFPRFIYRLQRPLLQNTGDRIISQVVRSVSRRLTPKVQEDFHKNLGIPFQKLKQNKKPS